MSESIPDSNEISDEISKLTNITPNTSQNCDSVLINNNCKIFVNTDDDKTVLLNDGTIVTSNTSDTNGALISNFDISGDSDKSFPKPILNNGGASISRQIPKKSVSFGTDDEKIQKFISGEVIVDQKNPFINSNAINRAEFFKSYIAATPVILPPEEFITTKEVLNESKFVKTYVKNPDKYFTYDPTLKENLNKVELESRNNIPNRISKISKPTKERIKEQKYKYASPISYSQPKSSKSSSNEVDSRFLSRNKTIDKSKYPDLSQIKVKVGTDLEESLFNPAEVTLNAKKFDDRIKNTSFGSQDDLDDIAELTSTSLESVIENNKSENTKQLYIDTITKDEQPKKSFTNTVNSKEFQDYLKQKGLFLIPDTKIPEKKVNGKAEPLLKIVEMNGKSSDMEEKKAKKPSVLQRLFPSRMFASKRRTTPKDPIPEPKNLYNSDDLSNSSGTKRVVLERRSFHAGNSSTTPNNSDFSKQLKDRYPKHGLDDGSSSISSALTNAEDYVDMNITTSPIKHKKVNKENYVEMKANLKSSQKYDDFNTDIFNGKTYYSTVSRNLDIHSNISKPSPKLLQYNENGSTNSPLSADISAYKNKVRPVNRIKPPSGRSSVPVMGLSERTDQIRLSNNSSAIPQLIKLKVDQPLSFQNTSPDVRDGIIKPRVQRPNVPISNLKPLPGRHLNQTLPENKSAKLPVPMKRTSERQSLNYKKPSEETNTYGNLNRAVSLNKSEIRKRNPPKPLERSKPVNSQGVTVQIRIAETPENNLQPIEQHILPIDRTPNTSSEYVLDAPKGSSTPKANTPSSEFIPNSNNSKKSDFYFHKKSNNISPIIAPNSQPNTIPSQKLDLDPYSWAKLRELKEKTDRQLFIKPLSIQTELQQNIYGRPIECQRENIYEKLPTRDGNNVQQSPGLYVQTEEILLQNNSPQRRDQQKQHQNLSKIPAQKVQLNQPSQNFIRNSTQRNTIGSVFRNRDLKLIDGKYMDESGFVQLIPLDHIQQQVAARQAAPQQQPVRCQSVLDEMINRDNYGSLNNRGSPNPVIMRRKQPLTLTREEIMSKVTEFCRKSMNRTPTSNFQGSIDQLSNKHALPKTSSSEISPVSYASLESRATPSISSTRSSVKVAPQVPQRVQSLQQQQQLHQQRQQQQLQQQQQLLQQQQAKEYQNQSSPIYAPIFKRNSIQSNSSEVFDSPGSRRNKNINQNQHSRLQTYSETDSVFLSEEIPQPRNYIVMDSDKITPSQVMTYQTTPIPSKRIPPDAFYTSRQSADVYGWFYPKDGQHYVQVRNLPQKVDQIYYPNNGSLRGSQQNVLTNRIRIDGRTTPLVLHAIPNQQSQNVQPIAVPNLIYGGRTGTIVVLDNLDKMYRPIVPSKTITQPQIRQSLVKSGKYIVPYESESASEAEEVQKILQNRRNEEDWQNDKGRNQQNEQVTDDRRRGARREDPRRHTLGNDMLGYGQGQGLPQRAMDLEAPPVRGYTPVSQGPLFDDDPGIMSEVETASTGFRRGGKQRSSLPVVRTPSKTLERPLGLVFLQYRSETKRALLPNEITSIDTVRALFVRSFPRQLTMAYLEGPNVKIYIHDASKDMFYELEDVRSHLREIRDRSVLRLFESNEVAAPQVLPGGPGVPQPLPSNGGHWDQDQSYFSEPEFDTEYQHQHVHKSKGGKGTQYYVGAAQTLPRGMYSDRNKNVVDGYMSSPERGTRGGYEEPYYSQYGTRGISVTPIIDEEQSESSLNEDQYALYGHKVSGRIPRSANQLYDPTRPEDLHRIRVEHMERQLANLTGLVQKALTQNVPAGPPGGSINQNYLAVSNQYRGDKSVSFEKSVSFSDDIQGVPKPHIPQHPERDRLKPPPPPKPLGLAPAHNSYRPDIALAPEVYNHLRGLQKKAKDLRMEMRTLRRLSQAQAVAVREDIKDAFMGIRATLMASTGTYWGQGDQEKTRLSREEEMYKQEVIRLEKDLSDLESSVEGLRGEVINRRTRVNMTAVEDMALVLSRASKTVAELKMKFPSLQNGLRNILSNEMEKVVREEKFLKEEPDRLESALRRCKKLTGTLVTLKRLASVQEQRLPCADPPSDEAPRTTDVPTTNKPIPSPRLGTVTVSGGVAPENALDALLDELQTFAKPPTGNTEPRPDDSTSDDSSQTLQSTVTTQLSQTSLYPTDPLNPNIGLRRLHSYPSGSDTDTSPPQPPRSAGKPPVPERNADLLSKVSNKRIPPPPPPRTSSRSPLASPTSPNVPIRMPSVSESSSDQQNNGSGGDGGNSSGSESTHSQEHGQRQLVLELRHQELLKKQKQLQEQYARLQQISKNSALPPGDILQLKKTGSESNLPQKMGLNMAVSGSMKNLNVDGTNVEAKKNEMNQHDSMQTTTKQ